MVVAAEDEKLIIERLELGPYGTNAYILVCRETRESVLVDTPAESDAILKKLEGTKPKYILLTHNHMDHLGAFAELRSALKVPVAVHAADSGNLPSTPDVLLKDGYTISFGKVKLNVIHAPGHTPGSLCFLTGKYLISGDTLFPGGPGKTKDPAAFSQIVKSLSEKIFVLPDDTQVFPGHGTDTILKREKEAFALFSSRPHDSNLCGDVLWLSS